MDIPFRWPNTYQSHYAIPDPAPEKALWFVFRSNNLLVTQGEHGTAALPPVAHPEALGLKVVREHYLGMLDDIHCYSAEVAEQEEDPPGWGCVNCLAPLTTTCCRLPGAPHSCWSGSARTPFAASAAARPQPT